MISLRKLGLLVAFFLGFLGCAYGQQVVLPCTQNGTSCIPNSVSNPVTESPVGRPNLAVAQVNVGVTATQVVAARPGRKSVTITNTNTVAVYCSSSSSVTTSNGFWIPGVTGQTQVFDTTAAIYCVTGSGTELVSVAEVY